MFIGVLMLKKATTLLLILWLARPVLGQDSKSITEGVEKLERRFAGSIFKKFGENPQELNWVLSPYGLYQTLGILESAAAGKAKRELQNALHLDEANLAGTKGVNWESLNRVAMTKSYLLDSKVEANGGYGVRIVDSPKANSEIAIAGLHQNDLILVANDEPVRSLDDFRAICAASGGVLHVSGFEHDLGRLFENRKVVLSEKLTFNPTDNSNSLTNFNFAVFDETIQPSKQFLTRAKENFWLNILNAKKIERELFSDSDFAAWMKQQSFGEFSVFNPPANLENANFLIGNMCRFNGKWGCSSGKTKDHEFVTQKGPASLPYFFLRGKMLIATSENELLIRINFRDKDTHMLVWIPTTEKESGLGQLLVRIGDPEYVDAVVGTGKERLVDLRAPKFQATTQLTKKYISNLTGLNIALSNDAAYPEISKNQVVGVAEHDCSISVDESGVHATSSTTIVGVPRSSNEGFQKVIIDRPFAYEIRHASGVVLFQGQVVDPSLRN